MAVGGVSGSDGSSLAGRVAAQQRQEQDVQTAKDRTAQIEEGARQEARTVQTNRNSADMQV
ncbi:MAG: hypothetical protein MUF22_08270 [Chitinispirillaceae bacterium]|nr:hypothetical protein [Chitinispirillaceae bacterium]